MEHKKNTIILIILVIVIFAFIYYIYKNLNLSSENDYIFFKIFSNVNTNNEKQIFNYENTKKVYNFKIKNNYLESQKIKLYETVDEKTLINEKIAPGVKGSFCINLFSYRDSNYKIKFKSLNKKPHNLIFYLKDNKDKYRDLEELEKNLSSNILKEECRKIEIFWEWEYDVNVENDLIDTNDAQNIEEYNFEIYIITQ